MTKGTTDLGDDREDHDDQRKELNESKAAKPNQLPKMGVRPTSCPQGLEKSGGFGAAFFSL